MSLSYTWCLPWESAASPGFFQYYTQGINDDSARIDTESQRFTQLEVSALFVSNDSVVTAQTLPPVQANRYCALELRIDT